ncbi:hypothetical protein [Oceanobacillus halophilus]|uniref:YNCE-like beta-propeller domain-containing protein n=1 Tax=Oceanobacillus halophilus TaxID=930130 RepID=A0A495A584_9BACI|nr:hypothetical protein [Oceanobacillus halophilus]RKQ33479.1 hypothetical protein D8M06_09725 [Oceanobacillus halophilus]
MRNVSVTMIILTILIFISGCSLFTEDAGQQSKQENRVEQKPDIKTNSFPEEESKEITSTDISKQFYVQSEKENKISIINLPSNQVVSEIKTGERPANVVFEYESGNAYVTHRNGNSVGVININEQKMIKEIEVGIDPHGIALSKDESELYITTVGDQYVYVIDTKKNIVIREIDIGNGAKTNYPFVYEEKLYITDHQNHLVYVIKNDSVIDAYKVGGPPMVARTNAEGSLLYVASSSYGAIEVFDTNTGEKVNEIYSGDDVTDFVIDDGNSLLVATNKNENSVSIIDLTIDKIIKKVEDVSAPKHISFNKDKSKVYFTLSGSNKVVSIDIEKMELVDEIEVGSKPHGIQLKTEY